MLETQHTTHVYSTPAMSAERETELIEEPRPIRFSGFLALALGLLSFVALFGVPMIIVPILATLLAAFALRPYSGKRPVGYTLAWIGLFAAILFGVWGYSQRHFHQQVLARQAVRFASNWLDVLAQRNVELALQLQAHPSQRQSPSMPLSQYYSNSEEGREAMNQFRDLESVKEMLQAGDQVRWELSRQPTVYTHYSRELVRTVWRDQSGTISRPIAVVLEYFPARGSEPAQWKVESVDFMDVPI